MATIEPQTTPQPPQGLPEIEPVRHVRLTPAWQDPQGEAEAFWLLEVPGVPGETTELRMMLSERHVVEMLVTFGRAMFDDATPRALDAVLTLCEMTLLSRSDGETVEALRALLVERASRDGM